MNELCDLFVINKDEALIYNTLLVRHKIYGENKIPCIMIAHGGSTASSIAGLVNTLLKGYIFEPFDMHIDSSSSEIIEAAKKYITELDTKEGVIILVDMGSLQELYEPIKEIIEGDLLIINYLSTPIAIDIGIKVAQNKRLTQIIESSQDLYKIELRYYEGIAKGENIIITCISGIGIAVKLKEMLSPYFSKKNIEIITMDFTDVKKILKNEKETYFKNTKFILTTTKLYSDKVSVINIEDLTRDAIDYTSFSDSIDYDDLKKCLMTL